MDSYVFRGLFLGLMIGLGVAALIDVLMPPPRPVLPPLNPPWASIQEMLARHDIALERQHGRLDGLEQVTGSCSRRLLELSAKAKPAKRRS